MRQYDSCNRNNNRKDNASQAEYPLKRAQTFRAYYFIVRTMSYCMHETHFD